MRRPHGCEVRKSSNLVGVLGGCHSTPFHFCLSSLTSISSCLWVVVLCFCYGRPVAFDFVAFVSMAVKG